jgi:hypothetical protein
MSIAPVAATISNARSRTGTTVPAPVRALYRSTKGMTQRGEGLTNEAAGKTRGCLFPLAVRPAIGQRSYYPRYAAGTDARRFDVSQELGASRP